MSFGSTNHTDSAVLATVVIPTYGRAQLLSEAVRSVLDQTHPSIEIVVVDDGSPIPMPTDPDPRVRVVRQENGGVPRARNRGVEEARGEFVFFLDDDDRFTPTRVATALRRHASSDADIVVCGQSWFCGADPLIPELEGLVGGHILDTMTPHMGATSVRRAAFTPFDERYLASQDVEWWLRIAQTRTVSSTGTVDCLIRRHSGKRHLNGLAQRVEFGYQLLNDHKEYFDAHPRALSFRLCRLAHSSAAIDDTSSAWWAARRAVRAQWTRGSTLTLLRAGLYSARRVTAASITSMITAPGERPRISPAHARLWRPHVKGPPEARLLPVPRLTRLSVLAASRLPTPWAGYVRAAGARLARSATIEVQSAFGTFVVPRNDHTLLHPMFFEVLETAIASRLIRPGSVVVDIGANRGWYSALAAHLVGSDGLVVSVEPDPVMRPLLERTIARNEWRDRVRIDRRAISDHAAEHGWTQERQGSLSHLAGPSEPSSGVVSTIGFDELLDEHDVASPGFIKIDVEGAEMKVLGTCDLSRFGDALPTILFEFQPNMIRRYGDDPSALLSKLRHAGYSLVQIRPSHGDAYVVDDDAWLEGAGSEDGRNVLAIRSNAVVSTLEALFIAPQ